MRTDNFRLGRNNYKIYERLCICGKLWFPKNGGEGKRPRCSDCYPIYRQAVILYHAAKYRTKTELDFSIEFIEKQLKGPCSKTGLPFVFGEGSNYTSRHPQTPSIDKIDPNGDYLRDNIQIVCWWYNCAKHRFSDSEVLELCKAVVNFSST